LSDLDYDHNALRSHSTAPDGWLRRHRYVSTVHRYMNTTHRYISTVHRHISATGAHPKISRIENKNF
jgi:hypothetical protein